MDNSFNDNGIVKNNFSKESSGIPSMIIQEDKKNIVGGMVVETPLNNNFALSRYFENGELDKEFGEEGKVITEFEQLKPVLHSLYSMPNNNIQAFGSAKDNFESKSNFLALVRYKTDGSLVENFGEGGKMLIPSIEEYENILSITLEGEGSNTFLVFANNRLEPQEGMNIGAIKEYYLKKYDFNGNLIDSFGENGKLIISHRVVSVGIQQDNKILLLGTANDNSKNGYLVTRYFSDGSLDNTFGIDGEVIISFGANQYRPAQIKSLDSGEILVLGSIFKIAKNDFALAKLNIDGTLDSSFGIDGKITTEFTNYSSIALQTDDLAYSMEVQQNGKIVVVGAISFNSEDKQNQAIIRYDENGTIDKSFGDNGKIITRIPDRYSHGRTVLLQEDGKILVGGISWTGIYKESAFILTRYLIELNVGSLYSSLSENRPLIYPNSVQTTATLKYTLEYQENLTIQLIDLNGQILKTYLQNKPKKAGTYQQQIDLPTDLPAGMYFVSLSSPNGQITIKVTK